MSSRKRSLRDEGAALALAMVLTLIALIVGSSLMLLSETETYASMNYQSMTQARFAAESGVHKAINYLLNDYDEPGTLADPINAYNMTVSPVQYSNAPVVLSSRTDVSSNYPIAGTVSAFDTAAKGQLNASGMLLNYSASAQLLSMRQVFGYGTAQPQAVQTWVITGVGTTDGARPARVEVTATFERQVMPFNMYGLFATAAECGSLSFGGGVVTDSYNSSTMTMSGGIPVTDPWGGDVGTNGNLAEGGGTVVNGTLSTPRGGVGKCKDGAVTGLTQVGNAQVTGGMVQLPQAITFQTPDAPNPLPATGSVNMTSGSLCADIGYSATNCTGTPGNLILNPAGNALYAADLKITGGATLHLTAGTYNINSISLQGNSQIVIDSGPVILNVAGTGTTVPVDLTGGSVSNPTFVPKLFQLVYGGDGAVNVAGGAQTAMMVFAPNANVALTGGANFYGAVLGKTIQNQGGTDFHYDRDLPTEFSMAWNTMLSSFSWKKY